MQQVRFNKGKQEVADSASTLVEDAIALFTPGSKRNQMPTVRQSNEVNRLSRHAHSPPRLTHARAKDCAHCCLHALLCRLLLGRYGLPWASMDLVKPRCVASTRETLRSLR